MAIRIASGGGKVLYRYSSTACTMGTIDGSIDKVNIERFLEIEG